MVEKAFLRAAGPLLLCCFAHVAASEEKRSLARPAVRFGRGRRPGRLCPRGRRRGRPSPGAARISRPLGCHCQQYRLALPPRPRLRRPKTRVARPAGPRRRPALQRRHLPGPPGLRRPLRFEDRTVVGILDRPDGPGRPRPFTIRWPSPWPRRTSAALELHAWFNPYRARFRDPKSPVAPHHVTLSHPEWIRAYGPYLWLDPGDPGTRDYSLSVVMDVVRRYDIDGVHFDDYFYPYPEWAGGRETDFPDGGPWRRYQEQGGKLARADWRRENVNQLVRAVYQAIKKEKPWVKFGVSPFGIWRPVPSAADQRIRRLRQTLLRRAQVAAGRMAGLLRAAALLAGGAKGAKLPRPPAMVGRPKHPPPPPLARHEGRRLEGRLRPGAGIGARNRLDTPPGGRLRGNPLARQRRFCARATAPRKSCAPAFIPPPRCLPPRPGWPAIRRPGPSCGPRRRASELKLNWQSTGGSVWLWVLQKKAAGHWTTEILPGTTACQTITAGPAAPLPREIALSAVDRCDDMSAPPFTTPRLDSGGITPDIMTKWMGAYWFRPARSARGGMPRMVRWPRKKPDQK